MGGELSYFSTSSTSFISLHLVMQLDTHGWFVDFNSGDLGTVWRMGIFRKIQKEVRRIFFSLCCSFQRVELFSICFLFVCLCGVSSFIWEYSPWDVCEPSNPESFFNTNFHPSQLACKKAVHGHWAPLICNCIVILWQFLEESFTKSSKFSLKKWVL